MAAETLVTSSYSVKSAAYIAAALCMAFGGAAAAVAQAYVGGKAFESLVKMPEQLKDIRTMLIVACGIIETGSIFALVIAIMLIFRS